MNISEEVGRITNILEDAVEEKDWDSVKKCVEDLDTLYNQLDRQESGFDYDYE